MTTEKDHPYRRVLGFNLGIVGLSAAAIIIPPLFNNELDHVTCYGTSPRAEGDKMAVSVLVAEPYQNAPNLRFRVGGITSEALGATVLIDLDSISHPALTTDGMATETYDTLYPEVVDVGNGEVVATCPPTAAGL